MTAGAASWLNEPEPRTGSADSPRPALPSPTSPSAGGWTAPIRPGLIPLRPLGFGELLAGSFRFLRTSPAVTVGSAMLVLLGTILVSGLITGFVGYLMFDRVSSGAPEDRQQLETTAAFVTAGTAIVTSAFTGIFAALLQGVLATVAAKAILGEKARFGDTWRHAFRRGWQLIGYAAITSGGMLLVLALIAAAAFVPTVLMQGGSSVSVTFGMLIFYGALFLLTPGFLYLAVKLMFAPAAIMLERLGVMAAIKRSWTLSRGHFWRVLGTMLLVRVIGQVATSTVTGAVQFVVSLLMLLMIPLGMTAQGQEWIFIVFAVGLSLFATLVMVVVSGLALVLEAGNAVLLYVDLRMRKEGLNIHLQRVREARAAGDATDDEPFVAEPIEVPPQLPPWATGAYPAPAVPTPMSAPYGAPQPYGAPGTQQPYSVQQPYGAPQPYGMPIPGWSAPPTSYGVPSPQPPAAAPTAAAPTPLPWEHAPEARTQPAFTRDAASAGERAAFGVPSATPTAPARASDEANDASTDRSGPTA